MADGFRVDTAALLAAVSQVGTAAGALEDASESVDAMDHAMQSGSTMDQGSGADDRIHSFKDRWRDEFGLIKDMLTGIEEALVGAAEAYATSDAAFAAQLSQVRADLGG